MYNVTRQEAADQLQISVRSVDRYIKSWKLRIKKEGKNIFIHSNDIDNMKSGWKSKHHIIVNHTQAKKDVFTEEKVQNNFTTHSETQLSTGKETTALSAVYKDLRKEIEKKDELIQNLALRVWKAEEIAKNSISINDFKKSQFLLEESKSAINNELATAKKQKEKLTNDLRYEKQIKILFFLLSIVLFVILFFSWISNI